jgi:hypothetical protein
MEAHWGENRSNSLSEMGFLLEVSFESPIIIGPERHRRFLS